MTAALIACAALCVALFVLVAALWVALNRHHQAERDWARERRELINRIQRPEYLPTMVDPDHFTLSTDEEPDEIDLIGTIADPPKGDE